MDSRLPKEQVQEILEANACCKSGARARNSKEFARINADLTTEDRLALISKRPYLNMGSAYLDDEGYLVVNAVAYHPNDRFECACPTVSRTGEDINISRNYCYCCGGHFKYHYELMLNRKLELAEILSSPHDTGGAQPCRFRFRFPDAE